LFFHEFVGAENQLAFMSVESNARDFSGADKLPKTASELRLTRAALRKRQSCTRHGPKLRQSAGFLYISPRTACAFLT
jgi:hypothetical protein